MKKLNQLFAAVLLFFFLFTLNNYSQMLTTTTVTGHVYAASNSNNDTTNIPVANAVVTLHSFVMVGGMLPGDSILYRATTDTTGKFEINSVVPGRYVLMVTAAGFETLALHEFTVDNDKDTDNVNLFLHDSLQINGGVISGNVKFDNSGMGVFHAIIEFINISRVHANIFTTTDMNGNFSAKIPAGQYYVSCTVIMSGNLFFFQEFYQNATSIDSAKIVTVTDGQTIMDINFDIPQHVLLKHTVTFQGKVQSAANAPLSGATVKIWAAEEHDWDDQHLVSTVKTDSMGNYSVTLDSISQSKNTFVVSAHKDGYRLQFYNGKNTFFQADRLLAFNDTTFTNVNFNLTQLDTVRKYSLSGTVTDTANMGINGAFIVLFDSTSGHVRLAVTDSTGNYSINGLASGSYYMVIYASGYLPQFYLNADRWENATVIKLTSSLTGINVTLKSIPQLTASGEIIGTIHSDNGIALAGVLITVKTSGGATIGSAISDANGVYNITGLAQGSYNITASITQYNSMQQTTTYDPSFGSTAITNFSLSTAVVTGVVNDPGNNVPTKFALGNNYPNPFNPSTIISFSLPVNSRVHLEVYNILGQKVAELINKQMTAGNYNVTFDASKLSSGVYLYRLQTDNFTSTKKMILAK